MTAMVNYSLMVALFLAWVGLFAVKDAARQAGIRVDVLEHRIEEEHSAIRISMTEWAILNEPSHLQDLAQTHLALNTMAPEQIVTVMALPPVPLHQGAPDNSGTFFASAPVNPTYSTDHLGLFMQTRTAPPNAELASDRHSSPDADRSPDEVRSWASPTLRPHVEG